MPQKKMIDRDNIPYRKMDKTIIEVKDCLGTVKKLLITIWDDSIIPFAKTIIGNKVDKVKLLIRYFPSGSINIVVNKAVYL